MARWKFGRGQTDEQERRELKAAVAAGHGDAYVDGQLYRRMIEAETERRRSRKAERRTRGATRGER